MNECIVDTSSTQVIEFTNKNLMAMACGCIAAVLAVTVCLAAKVPTCEVCEMIETLSRLETGEQSRVIA